MITPILNNSFDLLSDASLEIKSGAIINAMSGNPYFPKPIPALEDISFTLKDFIQEKDATHKIKKREELIRLLKNLAGYISYIADGDKQKLISSGFDISFEQQTPFQIGKPENLQVTVGKNPGELQLCTSRVVGAIFYNFQYTTDPTHSDSFWVNQIETINKCTLKNLRKGEKYWCRVGAVGTNDHVNFSNIIEAIII